MSHHESLRPSEQELERHLKQLTPVGHQIDRDALMFTAGKRSGERSRRNSLNAWRSLSAALLVVLLGLGWLHFAPQPAGTNLVASPETIGAVTSPTVAVEAPIGDPAEIAFLQSAAQSPFLRLRRELIVLGPEALPAPRSSGSLDEIRSVADWLRRRSAATM